MPRQCLMGMGGSASFDPLSIAGLKGWFVASLGTFQTAGGAAASSDGDPVGEWQDQSGINNHVSQATSAKRPTLKLSIINSLPAIRFDGVDDWMSGTTAASYSQPNTIFVVKQSNDNAYYQPYIDGVSARNTVYQHSGVERIFGGSAEVTTGTGSTSWRIITAQFNSTSSFGRVNQIQSGSVDPGSAAMDGFSIGTFIATGSLLLNGDLAEILVYNALLSGAEILQVEEYLNTKYAVY